MVLLTHYIVFNITQYKVVVVVLFFLNFDGSGLFQYQI